MFVENKFKTFSKVIFDFKYQNIELIKSDGY